ncbi:MAG TPA: LPXTG cell wall anchor domain-containing protein [Ramlibacter sp.]
MGVIDTWLAAAGAALLSAAVLYLFRRRRGHEVERDVVRLASHIVAVADTVEADLARVAGEPGFTRFANRCRECSERAHGALQLGRALRAVEIESLTGTLLMLHDDHRRMVDLRSELDRALGAWLDARGGDGPQVFRFVRPRRSGWPSSAFHTRPSTFG